VSYLTFSSPTRTFGEPLTISVIIPTLNEEKVIDRCLRSLATQSYHNHEVIVVDGGSSDKTLEIAERYGNKIVRLSKRRTHDVGLARNVGAHHARGDVLVFIDADTVVPPTFLEVLNRCFHDPKVVGVMCRVLPLGGNGVEQALYECNNFLMKTSSRIRVLKTSYFSCTSYRRNPFIEVDGFRDNLNACEDYDLALRLSKHGRIVFTDEVTVYMSPRRLRRWTCLGYLARYVKYLTQYYIFDHIYDHHHAIR